MTYHHLSVLVHRQTEKYGDRIALKYRDYDKGELIFIITAHADDAVRAADKALKLEKEVTNRNKGSINPDSHRRPKPE